MIVKNIEEFSTQFFDTAKGCKHRVLQADTKQISETLTLLGRQGKKCSPVIHHLTLLPQTRFRKGHLL